MTRSPAWAVDGGRANAAAARQIAWCATSGASGIITPTDLRVTALAVPGAAVNIAPGGAIVASTYGTAGHTESYALTIDATEAVAIPGGLPSQTTYYVICRIDDWHFNQSPQPAEPLTALYWDFDVVTSAALPAVTDPYITLAEVVVPANTAAITNAMITDQRTMANPREQTVIRPIPAISTDTEMVLTSSAAIGEIFPGGGYDTIGPQVVAIPEWATRVQMICTWIGVWYPGSGNALGRYWIEWGPSTGSNQREFATDTFRFDATTGASANRNIWVAASEQSIPAQYRGTSQTWVPKARYDSGAGVKMDYMSGMLWQLRFLEVADSSNS